MSYAPSYSPGYDFESYQSLNPEAPLPGTRLDVELLNVSASVSAINTNLQKIQRDDDRLANGAVHPQAFDSDSLLLIESGWTYRGIWQPGTTYSVGDYVTVSTNSASYICVVDHTSNTDFNADYAREYWGLLFQAGAGGDVYGPYGSFSQELAVYTGTTGKLIGNSNLALTSISRRDTDNFLRGKQYLGVEGSHTGLLEQIQFPDTGVRLSRVPIGQPIYFDNDAAVELTDAELRLRGAVLKADALAIGDLYQVLATADGFLFAIAPFTPGWSVSDTSNDITDLGSGATLQPYVKIADLIVTVPEDITAEERVEIQIELANVVNSSSYSGAIEVTIGVNAAQPSLPGVTHDLVPGISTPIVTGLSWQGTALTIGDTIEVWARIVSGDNAAFAVTIDGTLGPDTHSLLVQKSAGAGGSGGGDVTNPLSANLSSGGFDFIAEDNPGGIVTARISGGTGIVEATDFTRQGQLLDNRYPQDVIPGTTRVQGRLPGTWTDIPGVVTSDTPPISPSPDDLWFQSSSGRLAQYYDDGTTQQWVEVGPGAVGTIYGERLASELALDGQAEIILELLPGYDHRVELLDYLPGSYAAGSVLLAELGQNAGGPWNASNFGANLSGVLAANPWSTSLGNTSILLSTSQGLYGASGGVDPTGAIRNESILELRDTDVSSRRSRATVSYNGVFLNAGTTSQYTNMRADFAENTLYAATHLRIAWFGGPPVFATSGVLRLWRKRR